VRSAVAEGVDKKNPDTDFFIAAQKFIAYAPWLWLHPAVIYVDWAIFPSLEPVTCGRLPGSVVSRKRMQIIYSGRVQGVGFRYNAKSVANGYEVVGTVRNMPDGRVELIVEGEKVELEAFRQAVRESGMDSFVEDEAVSWAEPKNEFRGFEIAR
jgi:acylphosphatase